MNESKVRGLKWNLKKVKGSVFHFSQKKKLKVNWIVQWDPWIVLKIS